MIGIIIGIIAAFVAVILVRTLRFTPKAQPEISNEEVSFDKDAAVDALAQLVRCKTISYNDHALEDDGRNSMRSCPVCTPRFTQSAKPFPLLTGACSSAGPAKLPAILL